VNAAELLASLRAELAGEHPPNPLVPRIASGAAPLATLAALGAEELLIVASDRRSFTVLAARAEPAAARFLNGLSQGELAALEHLPAFIATAGWDEAALAGYQPRPGCQAYPAYVAWLALNAEPAEAILALLLNFAAWGESCATVATALRAQYHFDDAACRFFDFFATPAPELEQDGLRAVQAALDTGAPLANARRCARLLQSYEASFWQTLAVS
jgi:hypothetical protein